MLKTGVKKMIFKFINITEGCNCCFIFARGWVTDIFFFRFTEDLIKKRVTQKFEERLVHLKKKITR